MSINKKKDVSVDFYHRIYRLVMKKATVNQIATILNLPFSTVKSVVDRLHQSSAHLSTTIHSNHGEDETHSTGHETQSYLDIYVLQRLRYIIIDLNGMIIEKHISSFQAEMEKILNSDIKAVALLMANVKEIDSTGLHDIQAYYENFINKGRFMAILDPAPHIESVLISHERKEPIPIFGTEKAFEDTAFKSKKQK